VLESADPSNAHHQMWRRMSGVCGCSCSAQEQWRAALPVVVKHLDLAEDFIWPEPGVVSGDLKVEMQSRVVHDGGHWWLVASRVDALVEGLLESVVYVRCGR
jgi:hypothetical protein